MIRRQASGVRRQESGVREQPPARGSSRSIPWDASRITDHVAPITETIRVRGSRQASGSGSIGERIDRDAARSTTRRRSTRPSSLFTPPPHHRRTDVGQRVHGAARHPLHRGGCDEPGRRERSSTRTRLPRDGQALLQHAPGRAGGAGAQGIPAPELALEPDGIHLLAEINIALAVESERGLLTPVLRNVDALKLPEIQRGYAELTGRASGRQVAARRFRGRHVHHHQPGQPRHRRLHPDHQPAPGRDPGGRPDRREAGGTRRGRRDPADAGAEPELRPPDRGRRARGALLAADQAVGRATVGPA